MLTSCACASEGGESPRLERSLSTRWRGRVNDSVKKGTKSLVLAARSLVAPTVVPFEAHAKRTAPSQSVRLGTLGDPRASTFMGCDPGPKRFDAITHSCSNLHLRQPAL